MHPRSSGELAAEPGLLPTADSGAGTPPCTAFTMPASHRGHGDMGAE